MAAAPLESSRSGQREESAGSPGSSVTTRTPVPTLSSMSPEPPASPGQGAEPPGKNLWEQICEEYEAELPPFPEGYKVKQESMATVSPLEETGFHGFNADHFLSLPHFAAIPTVPCPQVKSETSNSETCSPRDYLETFVFPVLLPGLSSLLHQAKKEKCFEVRCNPEIQELRQWQKKLREDKFIRQRVEMFWTKQQQKVKCKMEDDKADAAKTPPP